MKHEDSVVVVESRGFSDKKIKIESLKNADGITIDGDSIKNYLDACLAQDLIKELDHESRQDIGVNHKPIIRYKPHKEAPGIGILIKQSQINMEYNEQIMQNLNKIKAPVQRYVITALLTGQSFTYASFSEYIEKYSGKKIKPGVINSAVAIMTHSRLGFLLKKVGRIPATWQIDKRALEMQEQDLYQLTLKSTSKLSLEDACLKYPFLTKIIEEKEGVEIKLPDRQAEEVKQCNEQTHIEPAIEPAKDEKESLANAISKTLSNEKFDINININFRIFFG